MKTVWTIGLIAFAAAAFMTQQALSQDKSEQEGKPGQGMKSPDSEQSQAMMMEYMKLMQPGQGHQKLDHFVGEWDQSTKMWWGGPGSEPMKSSGASTIKWVLGKRFLMEEMKGEMEFPDGAGGTMKVPSEGIGLTGYDNFRNMYVSCWASNMGTHLLTMEGTSAPDSKVITYYGEMDEPGVAIGRTVKYVSRVIDKDKWVFEIYDLAAGDDYKVVEVTYTRRK